MHMCNRNPWENRWWYAIKCSFHGEVQRSCCLQWKLPLKWLRKRSLTSVQVIECSRIRVNNNMSSPITNRVLYVSKREKAWSERDDTQRVLATMNRCYFSENTIGFLLSSPLKQAFAPGSIFLFSFLVGVELVFYPPGTNEYVQQRLWWIYSFDRLFTFNDISFHLAFSVIISTISYSTPRMAMYRDFPNGKHNKCQNWSLKHSLVQSIFLLSPVK